jgi:hypothetical protein
MKPLIAGSRSQVALTPALALSLVVVAAGGPQASASETGSVAS